ncbi:MAG: hypothetical protein IKL20_07120 [Alistipes sp.]|nr:hypothetical protein [Alistipes sp.]
MKIFLTFLMLLAAITVSAQDVNPQDSTKFEQQNEVVVENNASAQQSIERPTVTVQAHGDAANIINQNLRVAGKKIKAYRILIYLGSSTNARGEASSERGRFMKLFPGQATSMYYETPYFKVSAGNFRTMEEAQLKLERIRKHFPKAFIIHKDVPLAIFAK